MSAKFSANIRPYLASMVIDSLRNVPPVSWSATTSESVGNKVTANGNIYVATVSGITGSVAPSHTSGTATDGSVTWLYLGASTTSSSIDTNLYAGIGDTIAWSNELAPPAPTPGPGTETSALGSLITLFKLTSDNTRLGLTNNVWTSGTVYSAYNSTTDENNYPTPFYVIVNNQNIYKCIDNNNGATSTVAPTGTLTSYINTSDGYVWKFMGQVTSADAIGFSTVGYVPVQQIITNDSSPQWNVQQAAQAGSLSAFTNYVANGVAFSTSSPTVTIVGSGSGATATADLDGSDFLRRILVTNGGTGYGSQNFAVVKNVGAAGSGAALASPLTITAGVVSYTGSVTPGSGYTGAAQLLIIGDGTGATGTATVSSGLVTGVTINSGGSGYTWAQAFIIAGTAAAVGLAIMAPHQGHGANIVTELCANTIILSTRITSSLAPYVVDNLAFRQVSLVSGAKADTGSGSGIQNAATYIGPSHPSWSSPGSLNKYLANTGNLLYINNIQPITHTSTQEELLKITISF